jgi:protein phosphatase
MSVLEIIPDTAQRQGSREEQQDACACFDPAAKNIPHAGYLAVVADGMGGMTLGKEASEVAVRVFLDAYAEKNEGESVPDSLRRAAFMANESVLKLADGCNVRGMAGTTLIAAVIRGHELYWISVGDSRIYRLDGQSITRLNEEHNLKSKLERLAARGLIDEKEAIAHPQRDALVSYIGIEELTELDIPQTPAKLSPDCCILLCSDGLYRTLSDDEILSAALASKPQTMAQNLADAAMDKGKRHQDNITAITLTLRDGRYRRARQDEGAAQDLGHKGVTIQINRQGPGKLFSARSPELWFAAVALLILCIAAFVTLR